MRKLFGLIIISLYILSCSAFAANTDELLESQTDAINVQDIKESIDRLSSPGSNEILPKINIKNIIKSIATGNISFNIKDVFQKTLKYLFKEIYQNLHLIGKIIILVILCAILENLQSSFGKEGVGEVAFYACYIFIAAILIKSFMDILNSSKVVIENMILFMQAIIPAIFTLLVATGNIIKSTILQPSIIASIQVMAVIIKDFILPLIILYTALAIVSNISNKIQISKIAALIKNVGVWSIGIFLTIFIGIVTLQSSVTTAADNVGTKTAKFAVSTFVPFVGKILSDAVDTVLGYSLILKNSLSVVGLIAILLICLAPILKIFALIIIYRLSAAIIQPISDIRIVNCITEMANSLMFILVTMISVAVMFLISIAILINVGIPS